MEDNIIYDVEAEFFNAYLEKYLSCDEEYVLATEEDNISFNNLFSEYQISCTKDKRTEEESFADSYMFYIAIDVIGISNGKHIINVKKLNEVKKQFDENIKKSYVKEKSL